MSMWKNLASFMEGEIVCLEPPARRHEERLLEAARDDTIWRWMHYDAGGSRERFHAWLEDALAASSAGTEAAFATVDAATGEPVGSTRYLALRPEHRGLEIGWTWLAPARWQTGANVEAKLLMLEHAFERLGCLRVEFKTDSRNERSRAALAASRRNSRASSASTCSCVAVNAVTPPTTASSMTSGQRSGTTSDDASTLSARRRSDERRRHSGRATQGDSRRGDGTVARTRRRAVRRSTRTR